MNLKPKKMDKKSKLQVDTDSRLGILPKGLLFKAFGGFKNKDVKAVAESAEAALLEHLRTHNLIIDVAYSDNGWHLVFAQKPKGDVTNDLQNVVDNG